MTRGASLRTRLAVGVLVLTALGLVVSATVGTLLLRNYLVTQLDHQLAGSGRFADGALPAPPTTSTTTTPAPGERSVRAFPSPFVLTRLSPTGTVEETVRGSQAASSPAPYLEGLTPSTERGRRSTASPSTWTGADDAGYHYRAVAVPRPTGRCRSSSLSRRRPSTRRCSAPGSPRWLVGLLTLGLVGLLSGIGDPPRPATARRVEATAERIAAGDLSPARPGMPSRHRGRTASPR